MKLMKRALALLLCFLMLTNGPISAFATESVSDNDVVVETTTTTTETEEVCEECGGSDAHTDTCSFNIVAPLTTETPAETTQPTTEPTTEPTTTPTETTGETVSGNDVGCTECNQTEEIAETTDPQVGDKIWIKSGSKVYKKHTNIEKDYYELRNNYEIKITEILTNESGDVEWYKFEFTNLGVGEVILALGGYKYVHVDNTSVEEPEATEPSDENACDCGEDAPENIADHADSCPRKQYIKTLFDGKSAEEIYANWETYDEATQTDLLNMLKVYDSTKYEELEYMINGDDDSSGLDIVYVHYTGKAANGVGAKILAPEGSFPDGTTVSISNVNVSPSEVASVISEDILGIVAVDINFGGSEPANDVMVSLDIPANEVPAAANKLIVVHMSDSGPEVVGEKYLNTADSGETIAFKTDSFSSYAAVFVNGKYNAQKMSSVLQNNGNGRYQISTFNVDLFNYDPVKINTALNNATNDKKGFHFTGYGIDGMGSNNGINNSASTHAKQGILQSKLQNGFPVINYLNGDDAGAESGRILFDDSYEVEGKEIYNNIPFEFVYDSTTGYYEYKSSANHAQLNEEGNRIELYADSLSTENNYVDTLDLSTATGENDMRFETTTTNSFTAIVTDSGKDGRLDPYVQFTVDDVAASDVGQIYIKAKVPASVGPNQFQIFFNSATEDNTYKHGYTPNGDWIEFVIDTENISNWEGTISSLRVDLFDFGKDSVGVNGSYPIEIAQISLIKKDHDDYVTRGGFYPFSEIQDSYPGNNYGFNYDTWEDVFLDDTLTMERASRSIFNPTPSAETLRYEELAFGTVLEFDFYLPVNKTGLDGEALTYYFNGDDDLWVFVDNELVLDIGGGHGAVTGSVNFTDGTWNVENAIEVTGYDSGANGNYGSRNGNLSDHLSSPGKHTMKIFYLERGGSVSNCFMKFNLPQTPQGSVVVSKEVSEKNDANPDKLMAAEFEFLISIQNNGAGDQKKTPLANAKYVVIDTEGNSANNETDDYGKFTLKSGQKAYFEIDENYHVTVKELKKELTDHEWVSTTVNGDEGFESTQLTVDEKEIQFKFVNIYECLYGDLIISKTGISDLDHNSEETQSTIYVISGTSNNGETVNLEVAIVGNSEKVIKHIPTGTYTVTEKENWSWRYEPKSNAHKVTVTGGKTVKTEFENDRTEIYWLSGDSYCENWWGNSGNVVRKDDED